MNVKNNLIANDSPYKLLDHDELYNLAHIYGLKTTMGSIIGLIRDTAAFMLGTAQAPVKVLYLTFQKGLSKVMQRSKKELWKTHWSVVLKVEKMEKKQKELFKAIYFFNDADRVKQLLSSERNILTKITSNDAELPCLTPINFSLLVVIETLLRRDIISEKNLLRHFILLSKC